MVFLGTICGSTNSDIVQKRDLFSWMASPNNCFWYKKTSKLEVRTRRTL